MVDSFNIKKLEHVIISFSDLCGAGCIYCPSIRAKSNKKDRVMSKATFNKILERLLESEDSDHIKTFCVSLNGDCFLNKNVIEFLRIIRKNLPKVEIVIHTNFLNIDNYVDDLIKEELVDMIGVNINTLNKDYNKLLSKNVNYEITLKRLKNIIELRERYGAKFKIEIFVIPLKKYISYCKMKTGKNPVKLLQNYGGMKIKDDYSQVYKVVKPLLAKQDTINKSFIYLWAESENIEKPNPKHSCPHLHTFNSTILVNPNGDVYLCCYDSNYDLIYGNLFESNISQIMNSKKKENLVKLIREKRYEEIGYPCNYVELCQRYRPTIRTKIICSIKSFYINNFKT